MNKKLRLWFEKNPQVYNKIDKISNILYFSINGLLLSYGTFVYFTDKESWQQNGYKYVGTYVIAILICSLLRAFVRVLKPGSLK